MSGGVKIDLSAFTSSSGPRRPSPRRVALLRLRGPENKMKALRSYVTSQKTLIFVKKLISVVGILNQFNYASLQ